MNQFSLNPDSRTPDTANPFGFRYDPRGSAMYAPFCALLDTSYSMNTTVGGAVTRFQAAVKSLGASLRRLKEDDVLSDGVHLFLYTFGKSDVRCIRDNIALAELDIDSLERELLGIRPDGNTPMGAALIERTLAELASQSRALTHRAKTSESLDAPAWLSGSEPAPSQRASAVTPLCFAPATASWQGVALQR